jgi:hypothetical protein
MTALELLEERDRHEKALAEAERIAAGLRAGLTDVSAELMKRTSGSVEPRLSDHAVLRFIERALGLDVDAIRKRIMTDVVKDAIASGATTITVEGIRFKVVDGTIVTTLEKQVKKRLKAGKRRDPDGAWDEDEE